MHAQYFAMIKLKLIVRFWAEASSVLLTNLLGTDKVEDK